MSEAEVMERLGLRPWEEIQAQAVGGRRSGRTWRMLVSAVAAASRGQTVAIRAYDNGYEGQLREQARDWCRTCGVDPELILSTPDFQTTVLESAGAVASFTDHFQPPWRSMLPAESLVVQRTWEQSTWALYLLPTCGHWAMRGPKYLIPELDSLARPLVPPCPRCPKTLSEHRQAAGYDISANHSGRVCVEMDKLLEKGLSAEAAWDSVRFRIWTWGFGQAPRSLRRVDLEWAAWKLRHEFGKPGR